MRGSRRCASRERASTASSSDGPANRHSRSSASSNVRGAEADESAWVREFQGSLPPGDIVALGATPKVAQRLTGADPARVRAVARTASSPAELPPPEQLLAEIAEVLGVG